MGYWVKVVAGLVVLTASILLACWGFYHVLLTGTCASGGPYVSARPCPPGTGGHILAIFGGVIGSLVGLGLVAARGEGPLQRTPALIGVGSGLAFCLPAVAGLMAAFGPAATGGSGAKVGGGVAAGVLLLFGLPGLATVLVRRDRRRSPG